MANGGDGVALAFDLIQEARRLIRFNTVTWATNADCAVYVGSLLRRIGAEVSYQESRKDGVLFMNVVGILREGKDPLLLATHLDTVDSGPPRLWTKTFRDPFRLTVKGDTLYGLGVADTKLDILCKLLALAALKKEKLKKPILLLGTFGEESGLRGAACFCQGPFPRPSACLVGEPSQMALVTRHKGLAVAEILLRSKGLHRPSKAEWLYEASFSGKAAHSSTPDLGINAIEESFRFLTALQKRYLKLLVLSWEGGTAHNVVPAFANMSFSLGESRKISFRSTLRQKVSSRRLSPGWYPTLPFGQLLWLRQTVEEHFAPYEKLKDKGFHPPQLTWSFNHLRSTPQGWSATFDVRALPGQPVQRLLMRLEQRLWRRWGPPGSTWQFRLERDNPPLEIEKDQPLVRTACLALRAAGLPVKIMTKAGCSEAGLYRKVGIPSVVIGPGRANGNIHRPNESIPLRELTRAIRFYKEFLQRVCF